MKTFRIVFALVAIVAFASCGFGESLQIVRFFDDFLGLNGPLLSETGSEGIWEDVDVGTNATVDVVADEHGGAFALTIAADSEAEDAVLYFGDQLNFDIDKLIKFKCRAKCVTPGTGVTVVWGMSGNHNLDKDTVAQNAWFRLDASLALDVESDDGTTDNDDKTTAVTMTTDTYYDFEIDFTNSADVKFYVDGTQVATGTTYNMSAYTSGLQPYFSADKASGTGSATLTVDYVEITATR